MILYMIPSSVKETLEILASYEGKARIIAGGTDLAIDLRKGRKSADVLVDITRIAQLTQVKVEGDFVEVGAAVTFSDIKKHKFLQNEFPMLTLAAASVGATGIQTRATWVGNLVNGMPAADGAIAALALEAEIKVVSLEGETWLPVENFFIRPGESKIDSTSQLATHLRFQIPQKTWGAGWQRIGRRTNLTLPILNCAVKLEFLEDLIQSAIIALGPVGSTPYRAHTAERYLINKPPTDEIIAEAGMFVQKEALPRSNPLRASREYRLEIIPIIVQRALIQARQQAIENHLK